MSTSNELNKRASVVWGGDVNIGRRFHYRFSAANAVNALCQLSEIKAADLAIVNLECVVATCGREALEKGERASYYFRARPEMLEVLTRAGIKMVATANNHSGDYGPEALLEQSQWLTKAGIHFAGTGANSAEAFAPAFAMAGDLIVALFSIDATQKSFAAGPALPGSAWLDPSRPQEWAGFMAPLVEKARETADIVLIAVHWGANNAHQPDDLQIAAGHALIDAGADAVLGSSAHVLQGIEIYKNRPILHDAGDLLFDAVTRPDKDSGLFVLEMDHQGVHRVGFAPLELGFCRTKPVTGEEEALSIQRFAKKCAALGTELTQGEAGKAFVAIAPPPRDRSAHRSPIPALVGKAPAPLTEPRPEWLAEAVPTDALLSEPLQINGLELLGVRLSTQKLDRAKSVGVESWWRAVEPVAENWRFDFRLATEKPGPIGAWGTSSSHDPCDWMWPVSRWKAGQIYRDFYMLRPSKVTDWIDDTLHLSVRLVSSQEQTPRRALPHQVRFELNNTRGFSVYKANPPQYKIIDPAQLSPTPEVLWTAEQLQQVTGGQWLVTPPKTWYIGAISHKVRQFDRWAMPEPRFMVAANRRMAMRHELSDLSHESNWDLAKNLPAMAPKLAGAMVTGPVAGLSPDFPLLQVADPLHALMQLGAAGRNRLRGHVVAVTGSAGKTSQCLMLRQAMSKDRKVTSNSEANYNSRVGVLHHLANTLPSTDVVVLETASSAINAPQFQNIRLVRPDIAIITNITPSHMQSGQDGLISVARRKSALVEGMVPGGILLLNREIAHYDHFCRRAANKGVKVITFGIGEDADLRLLSYDQATGHTTARLPGGQLLEYRLNAPGVHMAQNSLACIGVRLILGGPLEPFLEGLSEFQPVAGRGALSQVHFAGQQLTLIDEAYNANPISMQAALTTFAAMPVTGRRVLILGDMAELGGKSGQYHRELTQLVVKAAPDKILLCGPLMAELQDELQRVTGGSLKAMHYANVETLLTEIEQHFSSGDTILLKASNSTGLGRIVEKLKAAG